MTERYDVWHRCAIGYAWLLAFVSIVPVYWMALASLRTDRELTHWPPRFVPRLDELSVDAYHVVLTQSRTWAWIANSTSITLISVAITLVVALPAAYALSRGAGRTFQIVGMSLFVSKLIPAAVLITPLYILIRSLGLLNSPLAVVIGNLSFAVPLATFVFKGHLDSIPREIDEAAKIDGTGRLALLFRILVPNMIPAISAVAVYVFIVSWNDFLFARTFLTGGEATTITVGATMFMGEFDTRWNQLMAMATLASLPSLLVFLALQGRLTRGFSATLH